MVMVNVGLNRIRDLIANDISKVELGTDGTTPVESDTGLKSPVSETEKTPSVSTYDKLVAIRYILYSTEGNGNTYREMSVESTNGTSFDRTTFYDIVKDNTFEIHIRKRYFVRNG